MSNSIAPSNIMCQMGSECIPSIGIRTIRVLPLRTACSSLWRALRCHGATRYFITYKMVRKIIVSYVTRLPTRRPVTCSLSAPILAKSWFPVRDARLSWESIIPIVQGNNSPPERQYGINAWSQSLTSRRRPPGQNDYPG